MQQELDPDSVIKALDMSTEIKDHHPEQDYTIHSSSKKPHSCNTKNIQLNRKIRNILTRSGRNVQPTILSNMEHTKQYPGRINKEISAIQESS